MDFAAILLTITYILFLCLLLKSIGDKTKNTHYIIYKTITSINFCLLGFYNIVSVHGDHLLLMPLLFCLAGDILLAYYNRHKYKRCFIWGLFAFLGAHIGFVGHMYLISSFNFIDLMIPFLSAAAVYWLDRKKVIDLKGMRRYCLVYSLFVSLLMAKGTDLYITFTNAKTMVLMSGGISFFLSDLLILFLYFKKSTKTIHVLNLTTYYLAMYLFSISIIV